ncbi:MAG: magnesium transporter, partial [Victivallales bacterium]|nr:magnesium transporter [Victivallales bacterium]
MSTEIEQQEELQNRQLEESILQMAGHNEYARLARKLEGMNPAAAALTLEVLPPEKQIMAFRSLPKDSAAAIFTFLDSELRLHIVKYFSESTNKSLREDIQRMVAEMPADDAADFIEEMKEGEFPANLVEAILSSINQARRDEINGILKYPDGSAGSIMTLEYIMLREDLTLGDAMTQIRQQGMRKETIYNCYAVADGRRIVGAVSLKDIILGAPTLQIRDIMKTPVIYAHTQDDQETVAQKVKDYDLLAIPVVDNDTRLVGIITVDDIMDVVEEENTEDFEKMAMLRPAEDEYLKTNVLEMARNRIFWLLLLMVSATLTGAIIMRFSHVLASQVVLAS